MEELKSIRKDNGENEKSLFIDNLRIITDMVIYLHSSDLCEYDIEIIRKDLIGMALESQFRGEKFSNVIGEDYRTFCNKLILNGDRKSMRKKILDSLSVVIISVSVLYILEIIMNLYIFRSEFKLNIPLTWGFVLSTLFIIISGYGLLIFIGKNSFKLSDKHSKKTTYLFGILYIMIIWIIGLIKYFLRNEVITSINCLYPLIVFFVIYIALNLLDKQEI